MFQRTDIDWIAQLLRLSLLTALLPYYPAYKGTQWAHDESATSPRRRRFVAATSQIRRNVTSIRRHRTTNLRRTATSPFRRQDVAVSSQIRRPATSYGCNISTSLRRNITTNLRRNCDVLATSWRRIYDETATSQRRLGDETATSWRRIYDVLAKNLQHNCDVFATRSFVLRRTFDEPHSFTKRDWLQQRSLIKRIVHNG